MSENRSLAVLEILVHLASAIPDRYVLGVAEIPDDVVVECADDTGLPQNWSTLDPRKQDKTRSFGDDGVRQLRSAILSVPSVVAGERNYVLNPAHPDFPRIAFADPVPFHFDIRLVQSSERTAGSERSAAQ